MFDIEYRSGITKIPKNAGCIEIIGETESHEASPMKFVMRVSSKNLYADMHENAAKVAASSVIWEASDTVFIVLSKHVLKMSLSSIEHIVSHVCGSLGMNIKLLNKHWVIGHADTTFKRGISNVVERVKKVYAGKILALYPANVATPTMLCDLLGRAFQEVGADVMVLGAAELHDHGFGLITGVGDSATNPPKLLVVRRAPHSRGGKRIGIVGKGVTFDSGGLAIKPFKHMHDMKFDKIGAIYSCMVLMYFLENRAYDKHDFIGVFPFVENAVSGRALRPGDVVKSFSGKTVEILNPDAEGRLVLADALSYIQKYDLDFVLDMATLTGHASDISCWHAGMFYTHTPDLVSVVRDISNDIGERMLDMPYWPDQKSVLQSDVADLVNSPLKCSDSTVAAMFIDAFVDKKLPWVHVDLAHEIDTALPNGNGIRTAIRVIEYVLAKK